MNKDTLRLTLRAKRNALTPSQQAFASEQVATHLAQSSDYQQATHIAFYLACDGELDLTPALKQALADNKACYLPVIAPNRQLRFRRYNEGCSLVTNRYGIAEPSADNSEIQPNRLDLVLAPLVAFDSNFNRLGMGGGFYDSTFRRVPQPLGKRDRRAAVLFGVGHSVQKVAQLEREAWDVTLDGVLTETGLDLR